MKKLVKKPLLLLAIGFIIGYITSVIADTINSNEVLYDNSGSGSVATNVQGALDSLFNAVNHSGAGYSILAHNPTGISAQLLGGLYRYQGTNPNNYICFGTTDKNTCTGNIDNYMYRIMGFNENGQLKLIKYTSIGDYEWNPNRYSNEPWSNCELFKRLNGLDESNNYFLNTQLVPSGWENRIAITSWKYGETQNINYSTIYNVETGFSNSVDAKIAVMYIHDYYYSNCGLAECNDSTYKASWLHFDKEHLITKYGKNYNFYLVYYLYPSGGVSMVTLNNNNYALVTYNSPVHPVFYLNLNQTIASGSGTLSDPYILN